MSLREDDDCNCCSVLTRTERDQSINQPSQPKWAKLLMQRFSTASFRRADTSYCGCLLSRIETKRNPLLSLFYVCSSCSSVWLILYLGAC
jgi:hypothetical protein